MSEQSRAEGTAPPTAEASQVHYDPEVLEQVLDDAAVGDRPDAFDPDAVAKVVSDAEETPRNDVD